LVKITVHDAKVKTSDWFWGETESDPNAQIIVGSDSARTDTDKNTNKPIWEETFTFR
jgi:hypothetical protein